MSTSFVVRWNGKTFDEGIAGVDLEPRLRAFIDGPLVRRHGCLLFEAAAAHSPPIAALPDRTGYEAFINKIHVEDFVDGVAGREEERLDVLARQGAKAASEIARRLRGHGPYRVVMGIDAEGAEVTLRFFERREGEAWGGEEPDAFAQEEVVMIDV